MKRATLFLFAILLLAGCETIPVAPSVVVAPTGPATDAQISAFKSQIEVLTVQLQTQRDLAARASAAVYGVRNVNPFNAPGLARDAVDAQSAEAASALPEPTVEQKLAKERQNAEILAGNLVAIKKEMGQTMTENQSLRADLSSAEKRERETLRELAAATAAAEKERREAAAKLQSQFDEMTAQIAAEQQRTKDAKDEGRRAERQAMLRYLSWTLLGLGAIGILVAGATLYLSKGAEWQRAAIAGLVGGCSFVLYWTMNQDWFKYLIWACATAIVAAVIWLLLRENAQAKEREALKQRAIEADEAEDTLLRTMRTIDEAPEDVPIKALTAKNGLLSSAFDEPNKALIHELKAETKRQVA